MPEQKLPKKRRGVTYEQVVVSKSYGRFKLYIRFGFYEDGRLGEVFIDAAKHGSELRSMINSWAILFSIALQHGVPPEKLVLSFLGSKYEPCGKVEGSAVHVVECSSVPDLVCQVIQTEVLDPLK